jgi:dUTP pyrophosphatase
VKVKALDHFDIDLGLPRYQTDGAAGLDISACLKDDRVMSLDPGQRALIPTGLCFEIPKGFEIQVRPRSGLSLKSDLLVVNSPGTIDSDYRGELKIILGNFGGKVVTIEHGQRVAQLVLAPVVKASLAFVDEISSSSRDQGGFGSTGK